MMGFLFDKGETPMIFDESIPTLLSTDQLAELLGIKPHTIAVWRCEQRMDLPYFKIGRCVRYKKADVEKWLDDHYEEVI